MDTAAVLDRCLSDLARRLDEREEQASQDAWNAFLSDEVRQGVFVAPARTPRPPLCEWPQVGIADALHDPHVMLFSQFRAISNVLASGSPAALGVRCNYGVGILASQFGCEVVEMDPEQGNTPTVRPVSGLAAVDDAIQGGVPDVRAGQGGDVFDTGECFLEWMARYPEVHRWVSLYHPDTQGPIDNAELVWGSDMFYAFQDCPERVHAFLDLMCDHYVSFLRKWFELVPPADGPTVHWDVCHPGAIVLRDDSLMNLPPEIYTTFIRDREDRCLQAFGGGMIHYCGRGDHFIAAMSEMDGLKAINLSQPELNDMPVIYANTVDKGIPLIGLSAAWAERSERDLRGRAHVK